MDMTKAIYNLLRASWLWMRLLWLRGDRRLTDAVVGVGSDMSSEQFLGFVGAMLLMLGGVAWIVIW